jgi:hypothetical protein
MQIPLQVTFEGCNPSEPARAEIEREGERLETGQKCGEGQQSCVVASGTLLNNIRERQD